MFKFLILMVSYWEGKAGVNCLIWLNWSTIDVIGVRKVAAIQKERLDCTYPFIDVKGDESNSIGAAPGPSPQWAHTSYLTRLLRCKIWRLGLELIKNSCYDFNALHKSRRVTLSVVINSWEAVVDEWGRVRVHQGKRAKKTHGLI